MRISLFLVFTWTFLFTFIQLNAGEPEPLRLALAGTSHGHISFILDSPDKGDFELEGVFEFDEELIQSVAERYELSDDLLYSDLEKIHPHPGFFSFVDEFFVILELIKRYSCL